MPVRERERGALPSPVLPPSGRKVWRGHFVFTGLFFLSPLARLRHRPRRPVSGTNRATAMMDRVKVIQGDITKQAVDAIVNAANTTLLGGGGVDGAIHREAGPHLVSECRKLGGCPTGGARITKGYYLPAKHVIHAVGPIWQGGNSGEEELLARTYRSAFELAIQHNLTSLAFPAISTGAYRFPMDRAASIAVRETRNYLEWQLALKLVVFVCYERAAYDTYVAAVAETFG